VRLIRKQPISGERELWTNLEYFMKRVVPVAKKQGVRIGDARTDDPPRSPIRGV
jgi:mannonate dehydratase